MGPLRQILQRMNPHSGVDTAEEVLARRPDAIHATEDAPARFDLLRGGEGMHGMRPTLRSLPHMVASQRGVQKTLSDLDEIPRHPKTRLPADELAELEAYAKSLGVASIGYTRVPQHLIFRDKAVLYDRAIVLTMEMNRRKMATAPSRRSQLAAMEVYHHLGDASIKMTHFLRERGYAAHAGHPLMGLALYPPLAQMAGLGWRGQHGMLITPEFGPRVRLAAVFTDIENLPFFTGENLHSWIPEFCALCGQCVRRCPGNAIYETPVPRDNGLVTCVDVTKCFPQFVDNHGCSVCIKDCPFHRGLYDRLKRHALKRRPTQRASHQPNATPRERA